MLREVGKGARETGSWGGEACGVSQGWNQEYVVHGIRLKAEVVGVYPGALSSAI